MKPLVLAVLGERIKPNKWGRPDLCIFKLLCLEKVQQDGRNQSVGYVDINCVPEAPGFLLFTSNFFQTDL